MRDISAIARDIRKEWKNPYFGAVPYLNALSCIQSADDKYGDDDAKYLIAYFLSNASTFRGEQARKLKDELKECLA